MIEENNPLIRTEMEKRIQEIKQQNQEATQKKNINLYLLEFNINDIPGKLIIGSPSLPEAIEKFLVANREQSGKWEVVRISINQTAIL
jgi:hypothetical protein